MISEVKKGLNFSLKEMPMDKKPLKYKQKHYLQVDT